MFKALLYKEWLKVRWAFLVMLGLFAVALIKITLNISYNIRFMDANAYWYDLVIRGRLFYSDLIYLPLLAGLVIAATQYFPEMSANRLKLTLHLPLRENSILLHMAASGIMALLIVYMVSFIILSIITLNFFPIQMLISVFITTLPWYLAGLVTYLAAAMIFVEPIWIRRIILILVAYGFVDSLLYVRGFNLYERSLPLFMFLSLFYSLSVLYSGHRFRKGVM